MQHDALSVFWLGPKTQLILIPILFIFNKVLLASRVWPEINHGMLSK